MGNYRTALKIWNPDWLYTGNLLNYEKRYKFIIISFGPDATTFELLGFFL